MEEKRRNEGRPAVTRRKFLQGIAFSAAALAMNQVIAACAPAAPTSAPGAATSAPAVPTSNSGAATSAPAATTGAPIKPTSVLRIGHDTVVQSNVDPHAIQGYQIQVLENLYEPLAYPSDSISNMRPVLAESYKVSDDGRITTFNLRKNVQFQDGTLLDAATVKLSFDRYMALKQGLSQDELNQNVVAITTPDQNTVVFEVKPGGLPLVSVQTGVLIVSSKAIKDHITTADPWATQYLAQHVAGTGPYQLAELRPGDLMRITKFDKYWGGWDGNHVDEADWLQVPEAVTQDLMLEKGDLDVSYIVPPETIPSLKNNPKFQVLEARGTYAFYLRMNASGGPLADKTLRQAFAYAFDYDSFNKASQDWLPPDGPVPSELLGGWRPPNLYKYDIVKAKQLYAQAGYGPNKPLKIDQVILAGYPDQLAAAQILQQGLSQLGVDYSITTGQFAPLYQGLLRWVKTGDKTGYHDMFALKYPAQFPEAAAQLTPYRTGKDLNYMGYKNDEADALIAKALLTPDAQARTDLYKQAITKIVDDAPDIWVGVQQRRVVLGSAVKGFTMPPIWWPAIRVYPISLQR